MIHRFKHHRMAQGKLGATDKYPFTVTQTLLLHTQTDKLWGTLILGMHTSCCTITHTQRTCCVSFQGLFPLQICIPRTNQKKADRAMLF